MPLYEYQCDACGHKFERIQKFSDALEKQCPECGGVVQKLISSPAIQFKGTGWYITDYARKGTSDNQGNGAKSDAAKPKAKDGDSSTTDTSKGASRDTSDTSKKDKSSPASKGSTPSSTGPSSSSGSSSSDS